MNRPDNGLQFKEIFNENLAKNKKTPPTNGKINTIPPSIIQLHLALL